MEIYGLLTEKKLEKNIQPKVKKKSMHDVLIKQFFKEQIETKKKIYISSWSQKIAKS